MATKEKTFLTIEVLNILAWYKAVRSDAEHMTKINSLPVKMQWALKKNIELFNPIATSYDEVKADLENSLRDEYFGEEKSFATTQEQNGETINVRQVKDEYLEEYNSKIQEVNQKLQELLVQSNEVAVSVVDIDSMIDALPDQVSLTMEDLDILSFMAD